MPFAHIDTGSTTNSNDYSWFNAFHKLNTLYYMRNGGSGTTSVDVVTLFLLSINPSHT